MPIVTLLEKVYGPFSPNSFEPLLSSLFKGIKVTSKVVGKTDRGWIQVELSGEDEIAALHLISQKVGLAPASVEQLKKFSVQRGRVALFDKKTKGLYIDIGVFSRKIFVFIPLYVLQAQLSDGKKVSLSELARLFCLCENLPLAVKLVESIDPQQDSVEGELSEEQLLLFSCWIRSNLDRLLALGTLQLNIERAVKASKHFRDIVRIESLGFLEHVILCKLGTDAVGLIPNLGRFLPGATLFAFSPKRIRQLSDRPW